MYIHICITSYSLSSIVLSLTAAFAALEPSKACEGSCGEGCNLSGPGVQSTEDEQNWDIEDPLRDFSHWTRTVSSFFWGEYVFVGPPRLTEIHDI